MAPANPLPIEQVDTSLSDTEPVSQQELNAWRRGFTPQAEIWNGRLAMLGLSVGLGVLLLVRLAGG
ncbi:high light inducible protein [Synechococcus sp. CS-1332]|uniref:high light inducible protein n=1 Tax=Synechococcus sp. CS-1332 TaxID=2847972 RepID=UPI00223AC9AC|nr:high light inducible protein [Synechococcus sp. CS-1332]MCT0207321.1 high light inducible protein [Synechococcus sp. CS-1332]